MNRIYLILAVCAVLIAGDPPIDPAVQAACKRGGAWLASTCDKDGQVTAGQGKQTATTALGALALAGIGVLPTSPGAEGAAAGRMLEWLLQDARCDANGYYGAPDGSAMYGHGIVSLYFAELLGMGVDTATDRRIRARLERAIGVILWAQARKGRDNVNQFGGWRYGPDSGDSDLSVTVWQLLALRAAKQAGLNIDKQPIDDAVQYLQRCYHSERDAQGRPTRAVSGAAYQPGQGPTYAMAAAGMLSFQVAGAYAMPEVQGSAAWLKTCDIQPGMPWFFYGTYYFSQGMHVAGGDYADHAWKRVPDLLLPQQKEDGRWESDWEQEKAAGPVYATSMAMLALAVQYRCLPVYQK